MRRVGMIGLIVGIILMVTPFASYAQQVKIACADFLTVFNEYQKTQDYEAALETKKAARVQESKLEEKGEEIKKMQEKLDLLKEKEQDKQKEKIQTAIAEYQQAERQIVSELQEESNAKMKEIIDDMDTAVKEHATKNGIDLIVNKNALLYAKDSLDVTTPILNSLNATYKGTGKK